MVVVRYTRFNVNLKDSKLATLRPIVHSMSENTFQFHTRSAVRQMSAIQRLLLTWHRNICTSKITQHVWQTSRVIYKLYKPLKKRVMVINNNNDTYHSIVWNLVFVHFYCSFDLIHTSPVLLIKVFKTKSKVYWMMLNIDRKLKNLLSTIYIIRYDLYILIYCI